LPPCVALALCGLVLATGANRGAFLWLNHGGDALGAGLWLHLTMFGDGAVALCLVVPAIRRAPRHFWAMLTAAVFVGCWTQGTKLLVDMPRPPTVLAADTFFQAGPAFRHASFPSGHAGMAFAQAGVWVMGLRRRRPLRTALLALAVLVGLSRVMVGVHWPLDVLWGALGGWIGARLGLALHAKLRWRTAGAGGMLAGALLLVVSGALLVSRHIGLPEVMPAQRAIGGVCLLWGAWEMVRMLPLPAWSGWRRGSGLERRPDG
jgi:membrane-associated phospholipid phosphatase